MLGANDGASGAAVLVELTSALSQLGLPFGVDVVFFDGEDIGNHPSEMCIGSKAFVQAMLPQLGPYRFGLVLDMVGKNGLSLKREIHSQVHCRALQDHIWLTAGCLRAKAFSNSLGLQVYDDHIPLIQAGIPTALLIDPIYKEWHTTWDVPKTCSADSLGTVGAVLVEVALHTALA